METNKYCNKDYWDMVRISNEDKEYPSNMGQKWSDDEETLLLEELNNNIDIEIIAQKHNRTIGGINSRRQEIAYKMYLKNVSIEKIINQTKLDYNCIEQIIQKKQTIIQKKTNNNTKKIKTEEVDNVFISINKNDYTELKDDVKNIKNDIKLIKNTLKELVEMMKAIYEFEDT